MEYKYYLYYLKEKYAILFHRDHPLYAYTDNNKIAKRFEETRDMSLFKKVKVKIDRLEVRRLATEFKNEYLGKFDLLYNKEESVKIPITKNEEETIKGVGYSLLYKYIYTNSDINPMIFDKKYVDILKDIDYIYFHMYQFFDVENKNMNINYLKIFISEFGKTLKGELE